MATIARAACRVGIASAAVIAALLLVLQQLPAAGPDTDVAQQNQPASVERHCRSCNLPRRPTSAPTLFRRLCGLRTGGGVQARGRGRAQAVQRAVRDQRPIGRADQSRHARSTSFPSPVRRTSSARCSTWGRSWTPSSDTLFLFLTSHGERALLAVVMPGLHLEHLTPAMLKSMLDRSGIKNRVIVIVPPVTRAASSRRLRARTRW